MQMRLTLPGSPAKTDMSPIRLVAGLGNPGPRYEHTRHNVGAWFVRDLARRYRIELKTENRFKGQLGKGLIGAHEVRLLVPTTFMNLSGESVGPTAHFFRIDPAEILLACDEMAFAPGVLRLKTGGGSNGHNGIDSVSAGLGNHREFHRLRIGVGHPGTPERVTSHLTSERIPVADEALVRAACDICEETLEHLFAGNLQKAMNLLHAPKNEPPE